MAFTQGASVWIDLLVSDVYYGPVFRRFNLAMT